MFRCARWLTCLLLLSAVFTARGQMASLAPRTLVVYQTGNAESVQVANHYATRRGVPSANLCAVNAPSPTAVNLSVFDAQIKSPVRACLMAAGPANVLYIVLAYGLPYRIDHPNGLDYSLDQALADAWDEDSPQFARPYPGKPHSYYAETQSEGNSYPPFLSLAEYRAQAGSRRLYSVWRLDGPTSVIAMQLVDRAILTETSGPPGRICLDRRYGPMEALYDADNSAGDWDLHRAAAMARSAGLDTSEDDNAAEFGSAPAPPRCDNAGFYAGHSSLATYADAFSWNVGAIGFHLDNSSAANPRGGTSWTANALLRGITVTSGAVASTPLRGHPHADGILRNLLAGANVGDAFLRNTEWLKWVTVNIGDPLYRPFPNGLPPFQTSRLEDGLRLVPASVPGGTAAVATVLLSAPAPAGGAVAALNSSLPSAASLPSTVTVEPGATQVDVPVATMPVTVNRNVRLSATYGGVTRSNTLVVTPVLDSVQLSHTSLTGGGIVTALVLLKNPAPAGGLNVSLTSSHPAVITLPASVVVPAGEDRVVLSVQAQPVTSSVVVSVSATAGGLTRTDTVRVDAPVVVSVTLSVNGVVGGDGATATIALSGPAPAGGLLATTASSHPAAVVPANVAVTAGSQSAVVPVTTTAVGANVTAAISAAVNGVSRSAALSVWTPIQSVSLAATSAVGGRPVNLTVTLPTPAPTGGSAVALSSSDVSLATVPPGVTVPAGARSATVAVQPTPVTTTTAVTFTAVRLGYAKPVTLTITPPVPSSVSLSPNPVRGGAVVTGRVSLNGPAPAGGVTVALQSSHVAVTPPPGITVAAGATSSANFSIPTTVVAGTTAVTLTALANGVPRTATLTVRPPNVAPSVSLTSPGGGLVVSAGEPVSLAATAADSDGTVGKVEFYRGTVKIGEDTTSPYSLVWIAIGGTHALTARVIDNEGAATASTAANVTVTGVRIMPLGDSLTHGETLPGSYRTELWSRLRADNISPDFVGTQVNGPPTLPDQDHQGHRGYRIDQIAASVDGWLTATQPQFVLLMIGTNDAIQNYQFANAPVRLRSLLRQITDRAPTAEVLVASIPPMTNAARQQRVLEYNAQVPGVVSELVGEGRRVRFVDMYSALTTADLIADGIHFNAGGYVKVTNVWYQALRPLLGP